MTERKKSTKQSVRKVRQIPRGYKPSKKQKELPARLGLKQWMIRAASNDQPVVVIDAVCEDEALQRAHQVSETLRSLGVWPALPVVYAEEHTGPVTTTWFRDGHFRALEDQKASA